MTKTSKAPASVGTDDASSIGYAGAVAELDQLLVDLERDDVDIDVLGAQVRRAAELIRLCRDRIAGARFDVEQIVADLTALDTPTPGTVIGPEGPDGNLDEVDAPADL